MLRLIPAYWGYGACRGGAKHAHAASQPNCKITASFRIKPIHNKYRPSQNNYKPILN